MRKYVLAVLTGLAIFLSACPAFAEETATETLLVEEAVVREETVSEETQPAVPTDPYTGEPITWDLNGHGEEDDILGEAAESIPTQEYSFAEMVKLKEMEQTSAAGHTSTQYLHISLPGYSDREWSESNVLVTLYRDGSHKEEIWLYRQQGFETDVRLPVGRYTFGKAEAKDGTRLFAESGTFDLSPVSGARLTLIFGDTRLRGDEIEVEGTTASAEEVAAMDPYVLKILLLFAAVVILFLAALIYIYHKDRVDRDSGYRNSLMD